MPISRIQAIALGIIAVGVIVIGLKYYVLPAPFSIEIIPRPSFPPEGKIQSLVGQRCVFLVVVEERENWLSGSSGYGKGLNISAKADSGATSIIVSPQTITSEQVAEVIVVPSEDFIDNILTLTVSVERNCLIQTETLSFGVVAGEDDLGISATGMREIFVPWLYTNYPDLGITNMTEWTGTIVNPRILIVRHYVFFSQEWEMYVTWSPNAPHDWVRIYLRHRFIDSRPTLAFEISSLSEDIEPHSIEVAEWV